MNKQNLVNLLLKELDYQETIFGDYSKDENLNVASLILIIEEYLEKSKKAYVSKWKHERPEWLVKSKEGINGPAPVATYEYLIKTFALAGAALKAFTEIDSDLWREDGIKQKWKDNEEI